MLNPILQKLLTRRLVCLYIFLACTGLMAVALYMQYQMGMEPCHLCIMQRIFFIATGLVALAAFIHHPAGKGKLIYGGLGALTSIAGGGFAIRQIYLQHLPRDQVPACGPSLEYMLEQFPLRDVISVMLSGDGNCAEISWQDPVIGLSIPEWSVIWFALFTGTWVFQALRK